MWLIELMYCITFFCHLMLKEAENKKGYQKLITYFCRMVKSYFHDVFWMINQFLLYLASSFVSYFY